MEKEIETIELLGGPGNGIKVSWRGGDEMFMTNDPKQNRMMRITYKPPQKSASDLRYVRSAEWPSVFIYQP